MTVTVNSGNVQINSATLSSFDGVTGMGSASSSELGVLPAAHFEDHPYAFSVLDKFFAQDTSAMIRFVGYNVTNVAGRMRFMFNFIFEMSSDNVVAYSTASNVSLTAYRSTISSNPTDLVVYCPGVDVKPNVNYQSILDVLGDGTPVILCSSVYGGPNHARELRAVAAALRIPFVDTHADAVACMSETFNWGKIFNPGSNSLTIAGIGFIAGSIFRQIVPCYSIDCDGVVPFVRGQYTLLSPSNGVAEDAGNPYKFSQQITKGTGNYFTFAVWSYIDRPALKCVMRNAVDGGVMNLEMFDYGVSSLSSEAQNYTVSVQDVSFDAMAGLHLFKFHDKNFVGSSSGTTRIWPIALEYVERPVPNSRGEFIYLTGTGTQGIAVNSVLSWNTIIRGNMTLLSSTLVSLDPAKVYMTTGHVAVYNSSYMRLKINGPAGTAYSGEIIPRGSNASIFTEDYSLGTFTYPIHPVYTDPYIRIQAGSEASPSSGDTTFDRQWSHWITYSV